MKSIFTTEAWRARRNRFGGLLVGIFFALSKNLMAQGCASCYTTAAAGGSQTAHALRSGILVLLLPPVCIFAGIVFGVRKWRNTGDLRAEFSADPADPLVGRQERGLAESREPMADSLSGSEAR